MKEISIIVLVLSLFVSSCNSKNDTLTKGSAEVTVSLQGIDYGGVRSAFSKNSSVSTQKNTIALEKSQRISLPYDDEFKIVAHLQAEDLPIPQDKSNKTLAVKKAQIGSSSTSTQIIAFPSGPAYFVAVYKMDGTFVEKKEYEVGVAISDDSKKFLNLDADETYIFIAYTDASTNGFANLDHSFIGPGKTLQEATIMLTGGESNFMFYKENVKLTDGDNILNIVLKNQFSQLTTIINVPSAFGTIVSASAIIKTHYNAALFNVQDETLDLQNENTNGALVEFSSLGGNSITSNPTIIWGDMADGTFDLLLEISGKGSKQFSLNDLKITPGVRYNLVLNIKPKDGFDIGGETWAPGNLIYDAMTNTYGFAATNDAYGDYFFPNYVKPKILNGVNRNPTTPGGVNGGPGDPCALVLPLNSWRLPSPTEFIALVDATAVGGADNPGIPSAWDPARYQGRYDGTAGTNVGLFFGTQLSPGANYEDYLFLPYGGSYNDNHTGDGFGIQGIYLLYKGGNYNFLHMTGPWYANPNSSSNVNFAVQIRCVKVNTP